MFVTQGQKPQAAHQMTQQVNNNEQRMREQQQQAICEIFIEANENQAPELLNSLSKQLEQQAFILSKNEVNKDYRTKVNTIKMRLKGTRGSFIRQSLYQNTISVEELLSLDMDKLSEESVQAFLSSKGRGCEKQPQVAQRKPTTNHIPPKPIRPPLVKPPNFVPQRQIGYENNLLQFDQHPIQQSNFEQCRVEQIIPDDVLKPITRFVEEEINHMDQEGDSNFVNKYNCPQSLAQQTQEIQQLHLNFIEGEDGGSNWVEVPRNDQEEQQQSLSPLPSSNLINQEFINETGPQIESQSVDHILDKEIEDSERAYYDNSQKFENQILPLEELQNKQFDGQEIIEEVDEQLQTDEKQNSQIDDSIFRLNLMLQNQLQENQTFYEQEISDLKSKLNENETKYAKLQEDYEQQRLQLQKVQENYKRDIEILQNRIKQQGALNYEAPQSPLTEQILQIVNENKRLTVMITSLKQELQNQTDSFKQKFSEKDQENQLYVKKLTVIEELVKEIRNTQISSDRKQYQSEIIQQTNYSPLDSKIENNYLSEPLKVSQSVAQPLEPKVQEQINLQPIQKNLDTSGKKGQDMPQKNTQHAVEQVHGFQNEQRQQPEQNQVKLQQSQPNQNFTRPSRPTRRDQRSQVPGTLFD